MIQFLHPTADTRTIIQAAKNIVRAIYQPGYRYHKCGLTLLDIQPDSATQQDLFSKIDYTSSDKQMRLLDTLNAKLGKNTLYFATQGTSRSWQMKSMYKSKAFTTQCVRIA